MTEGKLAEHEGANAPRENPGNKKSKKMSCQKSMVNECDGMLPKM
jgi:hypothetical protein